jgi:hypothetical protein
MVVRQLDSTRAARFQPLAPPRDLRYGGVMQWRPRSDLIGAICLGWSAITSGCSGNDEAQLDETGGEGQRDLNADEGDAEASAPLNPDDFRLPDGVEIGAPAGPLRVELGVPDRATGLKFTASKPGQAIPIGGVGQAGLTAKLAVRVSPTETPLNKAVVAIVLVNAGDAERGPAINNNSTLPVDLQCLDDGWCYPAVFALEISHLNRLPALEGTVVTIDVSVVDPQNEDVWGEAHSWGYFENTN